MSPAGKSLRSFKTNPSNLRLLNDAELRRLFRHIKTRLGPALGHPLSLGIGLAGTRTSSDRARIVHLAGQVWPGASCYATDDLETALATAPEVEGCEAKILVLSGTGSCCYGTNRAGVSAKIGGRGHIIGDRGSACDIGLQAVRGLITHYDRQNEWPPLGAHILRALNLQHPNELIEWSLKAEKSDIAALAKAVFSSAAEGDTTALGVLAQASASLAADAVACADRLTPGRAQFVFNGSVLLKNPDFLQMCVDQIKAARPDAVMTPLTKSSVWGAALLGKTLPLAPVPEPTAPTHEEDSDQTWLRRSPTEQRLEASKNLDHLPADAAVELMLREESGVARAVLVEKAAIVRCVNLIVASFERGGRLIYAGAGTSGRLGVLDASECPPTFHSAADQVQAIMAGGPAALSSAVEGAEDDPVSGAAAVKYRRVGPNDVVVGIAASGRTPFVWGALAEAKARGSKTALICFHPALKKAVSRSGHYLAWPAPDVIIAPDTGPEVVTGSTRLKAGTATKLILNLLTTVSMVRAGKVMENLMIDVQATNDKLRDRAARIVSQLSGLDEVQARQALVASGWDVRQAVERLRAAL